MRLMRLQIGHDASMLAINRRERRQHLRVPAEPQTKIGECAIERAQLRLDGAVVVGPVLIVCVAHHPLQFNRLRKDSLGAPINSR